MLYFCVFAYGFNDHGFVPQIFDIYDLCSDRLKTGLKVNRDKAEKIAEAYFAKKFKATEGSDVSGSSAGTDKFQLTLFFVHLLTSFSNFFLIWKFSCHGRSPGRF
jgi:hypothetical protein